MLNDFLIRIRLPFLKDRELYRSFHQILGFYPHDIHPYKVAMRHKSMAIREEGKRINNERLEFLGDAILDAVVAHIVFKQFPKKPEGFLTNTRSNIVRRQSLNKLAKDTGLDRFIISNFKQQTHNNYVNGNAFEALVGAIYIDRGYGHCVRFVKEKIMDQLVNIEKASREVNHKSKLIEWGQKQRIDIEFNVEQGKENEATPVFLCRVSIAGTVCGTGKGYSKKESQQAAAREALEKIKKDREFVIGLTAPKELQMERYDDITPLSTEEKQTLTNGEAQEETRTAKQTRESIIEQAEAQAFSQTDEAE